MLSQGLNLELHEFVPRSLLSTDKQPVDLLAEVEIVSRAKNSPMEAAGVSVCSFVDLSSVVS